MFSASKVETNKSRSSFNKNRSSLQPSARIKAGRSSSVDCKNRGTYVPPMKRTSSEERLKLSSGRLKWSNPRKSSINLAESKKIVKDSRPLTDKTYQKTLIQELFQFLEQTDFKSSITEASLLSPNKNNFEVIFKFLYNILDPDFVVQKLEDDVPKILKMLHYPFSVNKSAFTYVAKSNWHILLGILFWLLNVCKFVANFDVKSIFSSGDCERPHENAILGPYICSSYFSGPANEEDERELFKKIVRARREESVEELEQKYEEKRAVLEKLEHKYNVVQSLISENELLDSQILEYEEYFLKMKNHMQNRITTCEKMMKEWKQKESELEKLKDEIAQKHEIYDIQGFDGRKQQQHFNTLRKELHESCEQKESILDDVKNSYWEKEIQYTEIIEKLTSTCNEFNDLYASVTESAENMFTSIRQSKCVELQRLGKNNCFEFPKLKLSSKHQDKIVQTDSCMEVLRTLQKNVNDFGNYVQAFTAKQKQYLNSLTVKETELSLQLKILKSQIEKHEKELNSEQEKELQIISKTAQQYEAKVKDLEQLKEERLKQENLVREMSLELPRIIELRQRKEKELEEYLKDVEKVFSKCDNNWELCQKKTEEHGEEIRKKLKKLKDVLPKAEDK